MISIVSESRFDMWGRSLDEKFHLIEFVPFYWGKVIITKYELAGQTWYNFENLDQSKNYFKFENLACTTDRKAINRALKICPNLKSDDLTIMTREKFEAYKQKWQEERLAEQKALSEI